MQLNLNPPSTKVPPSASLYNPMASGSYIKDIVVSKYREILLVHEWDYRLSKGDECQKVIEQIIEDIASQGKSKFSRPEAMKILPPVSQLSHQWNPGSYPLGPRKF